MSYNDCTHHSGHKVSCTDPTTKADILVGWKGCMFTATAIIEQAHVVTANWSGILTRINFLPPYLSWLVEGV